jgi:heat shock protein HslJ
MTPSTSFTDSNEDSTPENCMFQYFDVPGTTSTITYKVGFSQASTAIGSLYTNRVVSTSTSGGYERGVSSIVATEIAA